MVNINLGCGPNIAPKWVNFDYGWLPLLGKLGIIGVASKLGLIDKSYINDWPSMSLVDIRKPLPLKSNKVNHIYCSHVLEHFEKYETEKILKECFRVLKNKGVLRVVLPDLQIFINNYIPGESGIFCNNFFGWYKDQNEHNFFKFLVRDHKWMYDAKSFVKLLKLAGFKKIVMKKFRVGEVPDLNILDLADYQDHSFYVEAYKI